GLSPSLDRNGDLSSGREATSRHGRVSAQERPRPDPAYASGLPGVQRDYDRVAAGPAARVGHRSADDRRPSLSNDVTRGLGENDRLGGRAHRTRVESAPNQGSPGLELAAKGLCKSPVLLAGQVSFNLRHLFLIQKLEEPRSVTS